MMKGNNSLLLNGATMIEAVQFWLNSQMNSPPKVLSVSQNKEHQCPQFEIRVTGPDETPTGPVDE